MFCFLNILIFSLHNVHDYEIDCIIDYTVALLLIIDSTVVIIIPTAHVTIVALLLIIDSTVVIIIPTTYVTIVRMFVEILTLE